MKSKRSNRTRGRTRGAVATLESGVNDVPKEPTLAKEGRREGLGQPTRQKEQQRLVEDARKQPGVAAAIEVFTAASKYAPAPVAAPPAGLSYATGGNQR